MRTWTAHKHVAADPDVVLDVLTDPDACRRWSPVPFDLDASADRLAAGTRMRVSGQLVGRTVGSRVILEIPPAKGYGKKGNPQAGIKGTDTLFFVVDILGAS